jgi:hypothetical protein
LIPSVRAEKTVAQAREETVALQKGVEVDPLKLTNKKKAP